MQESQRAEIMRQYQQTPKLHLLVNDGLAAAVEDTTAPNINNPQLQQNQSNLVANTTTLLDYDQNPQLTSQQAFNSRLRPQGQPHQNSINQFQDQNQSKFGKIRGDGGWEYGTADDFSAQQMPFQQQQHPTTNNLNNQSVNYQLNSSLPINNNTNTSMTNNALDDSTYLNQPLLRGNTMTKAAGQGNSAINTSMAQQNSLVEQSMATDLESKGWIPDEQAPSCSECKGDFSFFFRKHHCQICKKVFCNNCSSKQTLTIDNEQKVLRACNKCIEMHKQFTQTMQMQKSLLQDTISPYEREVQSRHFSGILDEKRSETPMHIKNVGSGPDFFIQSLDKRRDEKKANNLVKDQYLTGEFDRSARESLLDQSANQETATALSGLTSQVPLEQKIQRNTIRSVTNRNAIQSYLNESVATPVLDIDTSTSNNNLNQSNRHLLAPPLSTKNKDQQQYQKINKTKSDSKQDRISRFLDAKLAIHLDEMIDSIFDKFQIDKPKWRKIVANCTKHAVMTIKPSSQILNDSIDFNSFIKVIPIEYADQSKCQYVNGVVFKKDVANRRMRTSIEDPRVLLLSNSLGYVQEDEGFIDVRAEINQQESFMKIVQAKISQVNPDIIFIEKDASRLALEVLLKDNRTVVTNTSTKMLRMIARATQTVTCPSTNLLDNNFVVGYCLNFRVEQIKPLPIELRPQYSQNDVSGNSGLETDKTIQNSLSASTSLIFLEGCQAKLGCSIVLSGPDMRELKNVRKVLKVCLKTARTLVLEREYLKFLNIDIEVFKLNSADRMAFALQNSQVSQLDDLMKSGRSGNTMMDDGKKQNVTNQSQRVTSTQIQKQEENQLQSTEDEEKLRAKSVEIQKNEESFKEYTSPYLFEKHMERDKIVFENFRLVAASKQEYIMTVGNQMSNNESNNLIMQQDYMDQDTARMGSRRAQQLPKNNLSSQVDQSLDNNLNFDENSRLIDPENPSQAPPNLTNNKTLQGGEADVSENNLKRRLKNMCIRPTRQIVNFYQDQSDFSLYRRIRRFAQQAIQNCEIDTCQKALLMHTDYYYHGKGCIELKFMIDDNLGGGGGHTGNTNVNSTSSEVLRKLLERQNTTFVHFYCNKCSCLVMQRSVVPQQVLEMSYFKLLEQFFYNQQIRIGGLGGLGVSQKSGSDSSAQKRGTKCNHSLHRECSMIFRYGPVKIIFKFQPLDEYTLDLCHFGLSKGILSQTQIADKVTERLDWLKFNMNESVAFCKYYSQICGQFLELAQEEFPNMVQISAKSVLMLLADLNSKLMAQISNFQSTFLEAIFGEENVGESIPNFPNVDEIDQAQRQQRKNDALAPRIKTLMQVNRIHKLISARFCEFIFVMRKIFKLTFVDSIQQLFGKKNPFTSINIQQQRDSSEMSDQQSNGNRKQNTSGSVSVTFDRSQMSIPSRSFFQDQLSQSVVDNSKAKSPQENLVVLSTMYQNMVNFDQIVINCEPLGALCQISPFYPSGFNENAIEIVSDRGGFVDLSSVMAMALGSNLYLQGLTHLDYMSLPVNLQGFSGLIAEKRDTQKSKTGGGSFLIGGKDVEITNSKKVQIRPDVINSHASIELIEQEMLRQQNSSFIFEVSTMGTPSMKIVTDNKTVKMFGETDKGGQGVNLKHFYAPEFESIVDLAPFETPIDKSFFDKLQMTLELIMQIKNFDNKSQTQTEKNQKQMGESMSTLNAHQEVYHLFHEKSEIMIRVYFPTQFEALRKLYCGPYNDFLQSVFRAEIWADNSGGKTKSTFFKSFDNKYILKAVESKEIKMFEDMSMSYFEYLSRSFTQQCPTALAKTLGIFKIVMKRGKITETFHVLLMENLLLNVDQAISLKYDLKGSRRNRYIPKSKNQQVTLDNNFLADMKSRPIPMHHQMKRMLKIAIANDSLYLTKNSIIDYSLFVIINPKKMTVRVGIIDYIQQYTFDKAAESIMKQIAYEEPTIIPPEAYKQRFRTAMDKYFIAMVPDVNTSIETYLNRKFDANRLDWATKERKGFGQQEGSKEGHNNGMTAAEEEIVDQPGFFEDLVNQNMTENNNGDQETQIQEEPGEIIIQR